MDFSGFFTVAELRMVAAVLWSMVWGIVAGYLALAYLVFSVSAVFLPVVLGGVLLVLLVVLPIINSAPVVSWRPGAGQDGGAGGRGAGRSPGATA